MIDVTDVNDNIPNILVTEINGTKHMDNDPISLPECTSKGNQCLFIHSNRLSCQVDYDIE
jgi:hypothetical protein